jgi:predicted nucleotide-binding protein (sugar kinase/HSP70/actin superfamily)
VPERKTIQNKGVPLAVDANGRPAHALKGKKIIVPRMAYGSARAFAAGIRAIGLDADITPSSDHRTLELGGRYTGGDECYPAKITVGDFMRLLEQPDADPDNIVLFMATAGGPCRFGQYAPYLRRILDENGYQQTGILSPSAENGYQDLDSLATPFMRTSWRALVSGDILRKLLLKYRPYEQTEGEIDRVYETCLDDLCGTIESAPVTPPVQLKAIRESLIRCRDRFRSTPIQPDPPRPLIGVVGEIFCRLNTFSNDNLLRRLEQSGGEGWLSDIAEWVWYANSEQFRLLRLARKLFTLEALGAWIRCRVQHRDEHMLMEPFREEFRGYEEPNVHEVLENARPYLPAEGALGEMVLNVGKAAYLAKKGVDGIIDISPFTCMNGIVSEAIYPRLSKDLGGIPIRSFYFDGTQTDLERDLGVFLELVRTYQRRKPFKRG